MNHLKYREARGYAFKLSPDNYIDIVHDAYIIWFEKTGQDLFEQHRGVITKTIKNLVWHQYQHARFMYRGKIYPKVYRPVLSDTPDPTTNGLSSAVKLWNLPITTETPQDIMIKKEDFEKLRGLLTVEERLLVELYMVGFNKQSIAWETGISTTTFTKRWKIVLEKLKKGLA